LTILVHCKRAFKDGRCEQSEMLREGDIRSRGEGRCQIHKESGGPDYNNK